MLNIHSRDIKTIYYKSIPLNITCLFLKSLIFLQELIELLRVNFLLVHYIHIYLFTHLYTMCENITKLWSWIFKCILYGRGNLRNIRNLLRFSIKQKCVKVEQSFSLLHYLIIIFESLILTNNVIELLYIFHIIWT